MGDSTLTLTLDGRRFEVAESRLAAPAAGALGGSEAQRSSPAGTALSVSAASLTRGVEEVSNFAATPEVTAGGARFGMRTSGSTSSPSSPSSPSPVQVSGLGWGLGERRLNGPERRSRGAAPRLNLDRRLALPSQVGERLSTAQEEAQLTLSNKCSLCLGCPAGLHAADEA